MNIYKSFGNDGETINSFLHLGTVFDATPTRKAINTAGDITCKCNLENVNKNGDYGSHVRSAQSQKY